MKNPKIHTLPVTVAVAEGLFNLSVLEEMEDNEYLVEVLSIWLMESPKDIKDIKDALQGNKMDMVCKKAHKLKGSAGVIQAEHLKDLLMHIELKCKNGASIEELENLVALLAKEYSCIESSLKQYMEGLNKKTA